MSGMALFGIGCACLFAAYVLYGVWVCGMDTYMEATWWLFPPLVFVAVMGALYCWGTVFWHGLGLHVEVSW